jgi:hypothetical protein
MIKITDYGLIYLSRLIELENLSIFISSEITNEGLIQLCNLKNLKKLEISYCTLITTDFILELKSCLSNLEEVDIYIDDDEDN